ncbi:Acetylglutamate kinase [Planctomycetales bacterium 10988]|nr:Acetylglutamate kinase [Planctomycetales bacterium 10988]
MNETMVETLQSVLPLRSGVLEEAIQKADVLIEALQYIRQFRDQVTVIKLGGSVMETPEALENLLLDVVFMETVGMQPVIVHGGGAAISRAMDDAGIEPKFVQGRRYTDEATLEIVEKVLAETINNDITDTIEELGGRAAALNFRTTNVLFGEKLTLTDQVGETVDLGRVGQVTKVDKRTLRNLCHAGLVPVIPSMAMGEDGKKLNVNADTAATAVAQAMGAEKLVFLSDVNGVRRVKEDAESLIHSLSSKEVRELIDEGVIAAGMIPKVQACLDSLDGGVGKTHIIDGRLKHSLLLEIYTQSGVGTEIVSD